MYQICVSKVISILLIKQKTGSFIYIAKHKRGDLAREHRHAK